MPVLDARALDTDPEGMALLADVLRPAKRARRRKALRRSSALERTEPVMGRERFEADPLVPPEPELAAVD